MFCQSFLLYYQECNRHMNSVEIDPGIWQSSWMLTDAVPPPVSAPSAKSRAGQACSMYTSLGLSLGKTRLAVAPIQPNHAGCGNSLSNIKPATVLRLRRAPCSQTSAGSAAPTFACAPRRPRRHISLDCRAETRSCSKAVTTSRSFFCLARVSTHVL